MFWREAVAAAARAEEEEELLLVMPPEVEGCCKSGWMVGRLRAEVDVDASPLPAVKRQ